MNIKIIGVGKLKEKYFRDGIAEYLKRMDKFAKVKIVEVADEKAPENLSEAEMADVKAKEGDRILNKIKDKEWVIALAIEGKQRPSEVFAKEIADLGTYGHSEVHITNEREDPSKNMNRKGLCDDTRSVFYKG